MVGTEHGVTGGRLTALHVTHVELQTLRLGIGIVSERSAPSNRSCLLLCHIRRLVHASEPGEPRSQSSEGLFAGHSERVFSPLACHLFVAAAHLISLHETLRLSRPWSMLDIFHDRPVIRVVP